MPLMGSRGKRPKRPQRDRLPDRRSRTAEETDTRPAAVTTRCTGNSDPRSCRRRATSADDGTSSAPRDEKSSSSITKLEPATRQGEDRNRGDQSANRQLVSGSRDENAVTGDRPRSAARDELPSQEKRTEQHGSDPIGGRENERQVTMTLAHTRYAITGLTPDTTKNDMSRPPASNTAPTTDGPIDFNACVPGHMRPATTRPRALSADSTTEANARVRADRRGQGARRAGLRDRSDLDRSDDKRSSTRKKSRREQQQHAAETPRDERLNEA